MMYAADLECTVRSDTHYSAVKVLVSLGCRQIVLRRVAATFGHRYGHHGVHIPARVFLHLTTYEIAS